MGRSDARQAAQLKRTQRTSRGLASASSWRTRWGLLVWRDTQDPRAQLCALIFPGLPISGSSSERLSPWAADLSRPKWPQTPACRESRAPGQSGHLRPSGAGEGGRAGALPLVRAPSREEQWVAPSPGHLNRPGIAGLWEKLGIAGVPPPTPRQEGACISVYKETG